MLKKQVAEKRSWLVRSRAWLAITLLVPFGVLGIFSPPWIREGTLTDFALDATAWTCFATGATFRWWSTFYIGSRKYWDLICEGPYSLCRNPLYLGTFLITLSIAIFLHSLTFAVGLSLVAPAYLWLTVSWEEATLRARFGERYDTYCREVPRFLPSFKHFRTPTDVLVSVAGLTAEYRRAIRWMCVPLLAETVAHCRLESWWPNLFWMP